MGDLRKEGEGSANDLREIGGQKAKDERRISFSEQQFPPPFPSTAKLSCAKNHDIERRRAVVKLPRAREKEREEDTVCSVVHNIFSRDVISEIHTRETSVSYVTK